MALHEPSPASAEQGEQLSALGYRIGVAFKSLEIVLARSDERDTLFNALQDAKQRFDLWAVNLGLYVPGHSSLEYRLGDAPLVYSYTRQALADLQKYLDIILKNIADEALSSGFSDQSQLSETPEGASNKDSDNSDDEDFETYQDDSFTATAIENVNGIVDRLYRLSFKIRNPATRIGFTKAQKYQEIDPETGVDLIHIFAAFDLQHVEQVFLQTQSDLKSEDVKENFLVKRLARANTRRRQQFKQWRSHRIKIERISKHAQERSLLIPSSKALEREEIPIPIPEAMRTVAEPAPSMPSTATRIDPAMVTLDDTASITSSSTYARFQNDPSLALEIPQLPTKLRLQKDFECPYCHVLCSGRTGNTRPWNHHVLRDLRPYICTYEDCKDGDQQYDSFKQWLTHETHNHRTASRCKEHLGEYFRSLNEWRGHVASYHLDDVGVDHLDIAKSDSSSSNDERSCPICAEEAVNSEHVAHHLQQIALFALPKLTGFEDDSAPNDKSSIATVDDLEQERLADSDRSSVFNEERQPREAVYGVDFDDVGNMLGDLDPFQLAYDNRHLDDDYFIIYNPKIPRLLDIELKQEFPHDSPIPCVKFSPDARYVAIGLRRGATIYEIETWSERAHFDSDPNPKRGDYTYVRTLCFDSSGAHLATAHKHEPIKIFHIDSRTFKVTLVGHEGVVISINFVPNSNLLLSGALDKTVRLWDVQTGVEISRFFMESYFRNVAISPDGRLFAAGCLDSTAEVWNLEGQHLLTLAGTRAHHKKIIDLAFSPNGRRIVTGSFDNTCKTWDLSNQTTGSSESIVEAERTFFGHQDRVLATAFTKDGRWIVSSSRDQGIQIWDPVTGDAAARIEGHSHSIYSIDTSSIGNYIASASYDGSVKIWRYRTRSVASGEKTSD